MYNKKTAYALLSAILVISLVHVQPGLGLNTADKKQSFEITEVSFTIIGTSNVRDWEIESDEMTGTVVFGPAFFGGGDDPDQWFEEISLRIANESLDSGISAMNSAMHDNLETDEHPELRYRLGRVDRVTGSVDSGNLTFRVYGVATAAGNDHRFMHDVDVTLQDDGTYHVSGSMDLRFTQFNIEPPTFMRGALTTDNEMQVEYSFTLVEQ